MHATENHPLSFTFYGGQSYDVTELDNKGQLILKKWYSNDDPSRK